MTSDLLDRFRQFYIKQSLFQTGDRVLAAVSGGVDSMVMLSLLHQEGVLAGVVHVNYVLRGEDSDLDQEVVERAAQSMGVPCHSKRLTPGWNLKLNTSLQIAAREIRYQWFEEVRINYNFEYIATAHHLNDQAETLILNLIKGMSVTGLMGIPVKNNHVIRPMLFLSRKEIQDYALDENILWREDLSNLKDDYQRNVIRNKIIPVLESINPSWIYSAEHGMVKLAGIFELFRIELDKIKRDLLSQDDQGVIRLSKKSLINYKYSESVLYHLLEDFGFSFDTVKRILYQVPDPGKVFYSNSYELWVDREFYLLRDRSKKNYPPQYHTVVIDGVGSYLNQYQHLELKACDLKWPPEPNSNVAYLDTDKLKFPLEWRLWKSGDQFIPLGMSGHKKMSDFLIDSKVSLPEKERVTVLISNEKIAWVIGYRISQEFCLTRESKRALRIEVKNLPA